MPLARFRSNPNTFVITEEELSTLEIYSMQTPIIAGSGAFFLGVMTALVLSSIYGLSSDIGTTGILLFMAVGSVFIASFCIRQQLRITRMIRSLRRYTPP